MRDFDVLVLGSGPGGQKAAIAAAKLGRKVGLVERRNMMGGVCVNTGTIPSKTLREAVLYLTGFSQRDMYGASYRVKADITIGDLLARTQHVVGREVEIIRHQLLRNHVEILGGTAHFDEEVEKVEITPRGTVTSLVSGKRIAADMVMYSAGRTGVTDELQLEKAGLSTDSRGRIKVDEHYRTEVDHIYAVGDVIG